MEEEKEEEECLHLLGVARRGVVDGHGAQPRSTLLLTLLLRAVGKL